MISPNQKKQILKYFNFRYASEMQEILFKEGLLNSKGKSYSASMISNVMNGKPHKVLEEAIYRLLAKKVQEQQAREKLLKSA